MRNVLGWEVAPSGAINTGENRMSKSDGESKKTLFCSFCGKSQHEVKKLIPADLSPKSTLI